MFRIAPRLIVRPAVRAAPLRSLAPSRRAISTAPPTQKSRSFKSLVARVGIAGAIIYYYNNTDVFAEEPRQPVQPLPETEVESEHLPTIESISEERKRRQAVRAQLEAQKQKQQEAANAQQNAKPESGGQGGMEGLEEEADQQGAFNPETGEINWDCPCLGGMADGPCGNEFKAAFSCFIYSTEEPKGVDCIDNFKNMQNCFRQYPEVYGSELDSDADDEDDVTSDLAASESTPATSASRPASLSKSDVSSDAQTAPSKSRRNESDHAASAKGKFSGESNSKPPSTEQAEEDRHKLGLVPENYKPDPRTSAVEGSSDTERANKAAQQTKSQEPVSESERVVPKAAFDAGDENTKVLARK